MTLPLERRGPRFVGDLAGHATATALLWEGGSLSYADLALRVGQRQALLGGTRRLVLLTMTADPECIITYLACLAGGHPVLLTSAEAAAGLITAYDPDVTASPGGVVERRAGTAHELHPDLALLLSTSGSTGSPKLVRLSAENLQSNAEAIAASLDIRADDRAVTSLPLQYCYGLSVLHSHLQAGAGIILTSLSVVDPCFWRLFRDQGATSLAGVPHTFSLLERVGFAEMDLPRLRYVTQAGGRLAPEQVRSLSELGQRRGWDLVVMYGQTEATARMAYLPADLAVSHPFAIGVAVPGGELSLERVEGLDDAELVYRGPNVMLGYALSPADLSLGRTVEALRTGDLARRSAEGLFEVVGRRSRFVKVFGLRIDLDRVESAVGGEVACIAHDDELVVAVTSARDVRAAAAAAASGLPLTAVRVVQLAELPRTPSGKVDLPALSVTAEQRPAIAAAGSVSDVFARVLERPVPEDKSFVELGGDSLSYVEASVLLEDLLGHLPDSWHLLPVAELDRSRRTRRSWLRTVDMSAALRALAIVLVVAHHSSVVRILGGAHLLLGVAGYNFARFQLTRAPRKERVVGLLRSTARIAVPSIAAIAVTSLVIGRYNWEHLLLVHDLVSPGMAVKDFWFIEVLVQLLLAAAVVLTLADRLERRFPFALPMALLAVGLLARFNVLPAGEGKARHFAPYAIAWIFVWGWAAAKASSRMHRLVLTAVLAGALPGFFLGQPGRELLVGSALLLLLWVPAIRLPCFTSRVVGLLAGASLYVYVTHVLVIAHLRPLPLLAFLASFAVGIGYWRLCKRLGS